MPTYTIVGGGDVQKKLGAVKAMQTYVPPLQRSVLRLQRSMQVYPPAPAHSSYVRTGSYGKRWTTHVDVGSHQLVGTVGNNIEYGPFVGSSQFQTAQHAATR